MPYQVFSVFLLTERAEKSIVMGLWSRICSDYGAIRFCEAFCRFLHPLVRFLGEYGRFLRKTGVLQGFFEGFLQNPVVTTIDRFCEGGIFQTNWLVR